MFYVYVYVCILSIWIADTCTDIGLYTVLPYVNATANQ